ncbi:DUF885 domain-containing protein [Longimicrobium terrae]|uniref:Uncharacterized protein (DUF885 family) n=1 Tax=Longimicrobium terrae TaxID=1639882 RepID=A0A841H281_9BACT|nr:DUF885 domain-containing protein [Longimicrobium terrae]MBB4637681.1 uncharacterized protein (DUF885 family) [Longimicrobium terrae]MBB6072078.1 uncharacterized protein (DUF885 family) [Longimicrobium terrae]NNC29838.1 DUF885 domain-containing protein [Longimicrobium terrae]
MKRSTRWLGASCVLLAACAPAAQVPAGPAPAATPAATPGMTGPIAVPTIAANPADSLAAQVTSLANELMQRMLTRSPELATFIGLPGFRHDRLSDGSLPALARYQAEDDAFYRRVLALPTEPLAGRPEGVTLGFLREAAQSDAQGRVCRNELWSGVNQMLGWQVQLAQLAEVQPIGTDDLRAQALTRWHGLPNAIDTEIVNLREGLRMGYSAPKVNVRRVIQQLDALLATPAATSPFSSPATRDSTPAFRTALVGVVQTELYPAIRRYRDFIANEYLPAAREQIGVGNNPNGTDCYRAQVRSLTTLDVPAREIHQIGLDQMARIQAEMKTIARRSFNTDDVPALLERLRTDPQYLFHSRQEMMDYAGAAIARGKAAMPRYFGRLPRADVRIEPYPAFSEASQSGASYEQPADDGSRPGIYRLNTYEAEKQSKVGVESTAFHESIPGHHLQLAIAQERQNVHPLTRFMGNSGFAEGWGLYAERLADEMGLFSSDLDRLGLLSNEALRAARMVVDPGMHALGWSRQQAIDYMLRNTAENQGSVENEVDRYIGWPGQATAYMLGNLEIRRLREMAERELGPRFDIREFHDHVLQDGTVTLPMLRATIERWVAAKKAGA